MRNNGEEVFKTFSKVVMLLMIDENWREHLRELDDLKQSVQNATYEQKDPLLIYKLESFDLFRKMLEKINKETLAVLLRAFIPVKESAPEQLDQSAIKKKEDMKRLQTTRQEVANRAGQAEKSRPMPVQVEKRVGRNDPCPCGSGLKYKNCHGKAN
ncbi:MAG: SEC-C metal-binding domain-containing protein [Rikenellaceae bacterium]